MSTLDLRTLWLTLVEHPLFSVALTLIAFQLALALYRRSGWLVLQPVMVGMLLVVATLTLVGMDYARYREGAALIAMLLGPATVALAVPLYRHLRRIQQLFWPILVTLLVGGVLCVALTLLIAWALGAQLPVLMSLAPKSATMPRSPCWWPSSSAAWPRWRRCSSCSPASSAPRWARCCCVGQGSSIRRRVA